MNKKEFIKQYKDFSKELNKEIHRDLLLYGDSAIKVTVDEKTIIPIIENKTQEYLKQYSKGL